MSNLSPLDRAALAQVFRDPRTLRAFEALLQTTGVPGAMFSTGDLKPFAGGAAPVGWLECNGSAVSRGVYADLFNVTGTAWGAGDGSTTFNLPDLRGRALVGADGAHPLGTTGGATSTNLTVGQLPAHSHVVTDPGHVHGITDPGHTHAAAAVGGANASGSGSSSATGGSTGSAATGITVNNAATGISVDNTGSGDPVSIQSPYAAVMWLIKT